QTSRLRSGEWNSDQSATGDGEPTVNRVTDFSTGISMSLIDVDLSIFGQPESRFEEYERQIREEYAWVPATIFAAKRAEILRRFLARERIYSTNFFQQKLERRARENIQGSLRRLRPTIA